MIFTSLFLHSYRHAAMRFLVLAAFSFLWLISCTNWAGAESLRTPDPFATLKAQLIRDGFDGPLIQSLYAEPEVTFEQQGVSAYFLHREAALNYDQFLAPSSIDKAIVYLGQHHKALKQAQSAYGVEGEIITAIILVESRLGTFIGKRLVLNTLSTLAALAYKDVRDSLWNAYLKNKTDGSRKQFDAWASRKSAWAYKELKAYLEYTRTQRLDPLSIRGSFAGALGFAQFIPSSVLRYAKDGNQDGQVNLFHHEDAIESISNYLKQHGWRPSLKRHEALRVLLRYNNSRYYAETILDVADRLAQHRP
jgi:membrane-bound lytic murein transglycosylase B